MTIDPVDHLIQDLNAAATRLRVSPSEINRRNLSLALARCQFAWDGTGAVLEEIQVGRILTARDEAFAVMGGSVDALEVVAIAATTSDLGIGHDGKMPWHQPADLRRFRHLTQKHTMVMGRKTYDSIGRALPNRHTLVLTRSGRTFDGATTISTPQEALDIAAASGESQLFIAGGAEIYAAFIWRIDRLERTLIPGDPVCDTFFPFAPAALCDRVITRPLGDVIFETWSRR